MDVLLTRVTGNVEDIGHWLALVGERLREQSSCQGPEKVAGLDADIAQLKRGMARTERLSEAFSSMYSWKVNLSRCSIHPLRHIGSQRCRYQTVF